MWDVFDVEVDLRDTGQVVAQLGIDDRLVAGNGLASAGLVAMLADCILGTDAALRARARIATAVLTVDLVGSPPETGLLRAVSGDSGRRAGYLHTTAAIRDAGDIEVARVTGWFAARGGPPVPSSSVAVPPSPAVLPADPEDRPDQVAPAAPSGAADLTATPLWRTLGLSSFTSGPGRRRRLRAAPRGQAEQQRWHPAWRRRRAHGERRRPGDPRGRRTDPRCCR